MTGAFLRLLLPPAFFLLGVAFNHAASAIIVYYSRLEIASLPAPSSPRRLAVGFALGNCPMALKGTDGAHTVFWESRECRLLLLLLLLFSALLRATKIVMRGYGTVEGYAMDERMLGRRRRRRLGGRKSLSC